MEKIDKETAKMKNKTFLSNTNVLKIKSGELQVSSGLINEDTVKKEFKQELNNVETKFLNNEIDLSVLKNDEDTITIEDSVEDYSNEPLKIDANITRKNYQPSQSCVEQPGIHPDGKPHKCGICSNWFSSKSNLLQHTSRMHIRQKQYECEICLKQYSQLTMLKRHYLSHTIEKPFRCEICLKQFSQLENLSRHYAIHDGEKTTLPKKQISQKTNSLSRPRIVIKARFTRRSKGHPGQ